MSTPSNPHILHEWDVFVTKTVDETAPEVVNGQTVQVTRQVTKPVATRFGLRDLTRPERRAADLFVASRTSYYVKDHGLLLACELTNRLINTTGGVPTDKEKSRIEQLRARHVELDMDLARLATSGGPSDERDKMGRELAAVRSELINLNAINEAVYAQTAEAKAQADLHSWIIFHTIMVKRSDKWVQYFEGQGANTAETFKLREEFMWKLEDGKDEVYNAAIPTITTYVYWFNRGVETADGFRVIDEELAKQAEARCLAEEKEKAEKEAAAKAPDPASEPVPAAA